MLLSDRDLHAAVAHGRLTLNPFTPELVQPASVDVRLGDAFRVFDTHGRTHIDPSLPLDDLTTLVEVKPGEAFVLHPGEFVLGTTLETVGVDTAHAAQLSGKSTLGRVGLVVHATAGFIDPGFHGHITLELSNVANLPITLWPGMLIGQVCVFALSSPAEVPYGPDRGSHYQGQRGPTGARVDASWRTWPTRRQP
jgi:dCTP deaminase